MAGGHDEVISAAAQWAPAPPAPAPNPNGPPILAPLNVEQNLCRQDVTYLDTDNNGTKETARFNYKGFDTAVDGKLNGNSPVIAKVLVNREKQTVAITNVNLQGQDTGVLELQHQQGQQWKELQRTGDMVAADRFAQGDVGIGSVANVRMVSDPNVGQLDFYLFAPANGGFVLSAQNKTTDLPVNDGEGGHYDSDMTYLGVGLDVSRATSVGNTPEGFLQKLAIQNAVVPKPGPGADFVTKREAIAPFKLESPAGGPQRVALLPKHTWLYAPDVAQ